MNVALRAPYLNLPVNIKNTDVKQARSNNYSCDELTKIIGNHPPATAKRMVPIFSKNGTYTLEQVLPCTGAGSKPIAIALSSAAELEAHLLVIQQTATAHYLLAKKQHMTSAWGQHPFPDMCCGMSTGNLTLSLIAQGYTGAVFASNYPYDHCYTLVPFIIQKENIQGCILADPTAEQLNRSRSPRVLVDAKLGTEWEYITDWKNSANLYPTEIKPFDAPRILRVKRNRERIRGVVRKLLDKTVPGSKTESVYIWNTPQDPHSYLTTAFNNPTHPPNTVEVRL